MNMFRILDKTEEAEFRAWPHSEESEFVVNETYISSMWHPVVQDECFTMNVKQGLRNTFNAVYDGKVKGSPVDVADDLLMQLHVHGDLNTQTLDHIYKDMPFDKKVMLAEDVARQARDQGGSL